MSEDEGTNLMELSAEVIKNQRTNGKRRQARLISKIITLCDDKGSRRAVEELRKELVLSQELTQLNAVLETKLPEKDVGRYQRELDERVTACFKRMDEYAQLRAGQDPSIITGRSRAGSDYTQAFSRSSARSRRNLLEATKRRELVELQLAQEKRAEQLHVRTIALENELERLRLQERQAAREATDEESEGNPDDVDLTTRSTSSSRRPAIGRAASSFGIGRKQSHFAKQSTPAPLPAITPAPSPTSAPISNDGDQRTDAWIDHTTDEWNQIPTSRIGKTWSEITIFVFAVSARGI